MKRSISLFILAICFIAGSHTWSMFQYTDDDKYIVDNIIAPESNLTDYDVKKYNLLFLGGFAPLTVLGLSGYPAFKTGQAVWNNSQYITTATTALGRIIPENYKLSESMQNVLTSKVLWAGVAAGGVMYGMYPVLYSRTKEGMFEKLAKFNKLCISLPIANYSYFDIWQLEDVIRNMSINDKRWLSDPIQWCAALDNLVTQCVVAEKLLNVMGSWGIGVSAWQDKINGYTKNLVHNRDLFNRERGNEAKEKRMREQGAQIDMQIKGERLTDLRTTNAMKMWFFIKDIARTGKHIIEFGDEHKGKIAAGFIGGAMINQYNKWFGK